MELRPLLLRTCFTCDRLGKIKTVIRDDLNLVAGDVMPDSFLTLFAPTHQREAKEFWRVLVEESTAFAWNIPISLPSFTGNGQFDGVVVSEEIMLFVSAEGTQPVNSQAMTLTDTDSAGSNSNVIVNIDDSIVLNRMAELNNELINELSNLQRKMVNQNLLIDTLSRKLETNDQKFQLVSRAINDAIWDWNIIENTITWNQRLSAIYGYSESQYPGSLEAWAANIHPDERGEAMSALEKTIANGGLNWKFLYRYKCVNDTYKYTFDRGFVVYFGSQAVRMISVMQDIDERMNSLQEIEKLSLVASKTDNLVIITDSEEKIEWVNEGFIKKTGYTLNEVIGRTPKFMQGPDTDRNVLNTMRQHLDAGQSVTQEVVNYTKSGSKFWVKVNINPVFNDRNKLIKFVAVETDVTTQKEYENKITAIANDLTNLIATVYAPVFGIDRNGSINEWNNLASNLTGYTKNEVLGKNLLETIVDQRYQAQMLENLNLAFCGSPLSNLEMPIVSKHGKKIIILISATPRTNAQDEVTSIFLLGQDITELAQYRQSLEANVKERTRDLEVALLKEKELVSIKTRFASIVSHEFRTPLSTIKLSANHVKRYRQRLQPDEIDAKLDIIDEQVVHMTHMLEDVLTIGKSEEGKIELNNTKVNIQEFLHALKSQVENQFKNSHVIHCSLDIRQPEIVTDADLLRNIFVNLLSNAIKFSPEKHDVHLKAYESGSSVVFEVRDEGIGILPSDTERIFNPFDRGANTTSIPGTGLGLSIVKKAIELIDGQITFHSTSGGTTFTIVLPKCAL